MILSDNFNDNYTDPSLWVASSDGAVGPVVEEVNGMVQITFPANASQGGAAGFGGGYTSVQGYTGEFDVRMDFQLLDWPQNNGVRIALVVGEWEATHRLSKVYQWDGREAYVQTSSAGLTFINTTDTEGTLRMVRSGDTISGYFWDPSLQWVEIGSGGSAPGEKHIQLWAWSGDAFFGDQQVRIAFDNFVVYDQPSPGIGVPDSGATASMMLGALGCLMGLRHLKRKASR